MITFLNPDDGSKADPKPIEANNPIATPERMQTIGNLLII